MILFVFASLSQSHNDILNALKHLRLIVIA